MTGDLIDGGSRGVGRHGGHRVQVYQSRTRALATDSPSVRMFARGHRLRSACSLAARRDHEDRRNHRLPHVQWFPQATRASREVAASSSIALSGPPHRSTLDHLRGRTTRIRRGVMERPGVRTRVRLVTWRQTEAAGGRHELLERALTASQAGEAVRRQDWQTTMEGADQHCRERVRPRSLTRTITVALQVR